MNRIPPQAVEVEERVLGALLMARHDEAFSALNASDFYKPLHKQIFQAMIDLEQAGKPIDLITVETRLKESNVTVETYQLSDLTRESGYNVESYCQIIKERSIKRKLIEVCDDITKDCYSESTDTYDVVDKAQEKVFSVLDTNSGNLHSIQESLRAVANDIERRQATGEQSGLRTGLDLDYFIQGFQKAKLYVIGARPSMGKTALVMTIMRRISKEGFATGIISLETSHESLTVRLLSQITGLETKCMTRQMSKDHLERVYSAMNSLAGHQIYIDDSSAVTAQQLRAKCRLMVKKGVKIIFVDFLQLLLSDGRSRHEEIGLITKTCKAISKELDIPVVALSQLSRKVEERTNKRPTLADLRESGSIEEDADVIMFLYRPEYYGITVDEDKKPTKGVAEIIIAKHKDGETGIRKHLFDKQTMTFKNLTTPLAGLTKQE